MNRNDIDQKVKTLFSIWVITYITLGVASNIYVLYQQYITGYNPVRMLSGYQLLSLGLLMFYFVPFLSFIYFFSKDSELKQLRAIIRFLLCFLGIGTSIFFVATVIALVI